MKRPDKETNSSVINKELFKDLKCQRCPPNRGDNCKHIGKRGKTKPKYKNKRT